MKPEILTNSGIYWNFLTPLVEDVRLSDIAKGLSQTCRYGGHCNRFYSVAEHAVLVSYIVEEGYELEALHHDDAEAYIGDIPSPLKTLLPDFRKIETEHEKVIADSLGLDFDKVHSSQVKKADILALYLEKNVLFPKNRDTWACFTEYDLNSISENSNIRIECFTPEWALHLYLNRHRELWEKRNIGIMEEAFT